MVAGGHPVLVVVTGHPASGKSSAAEHLGAELGLVVFSKDAIKERLFDVLGTGDQEWSHKLGLASILILQDQAEAVLQGGASAVIESPFEAELASTELAELLDRTGARCIRVVIQADPEVLAERYCARFDSGDRHPGHDVHLLGPQDFGPFVPPDLPGPLIEVDATDHLDLDGLTAEVRAGLGDEAADAGVERAQGAHTGHTSHDRTG